MRPDVSVPQDGSGQREGLLQPCLPRSRIPPEGRRPEVLSLAVALLQFAASCRHQGFPNPARQVARSLALCGDVGGTADHLVMLRRHPYAEHDGVSTVGFWSSSVHTGMVAPMVLQVNEEIS